jgi:hypothetical protein
MACGGLTARCPAVTCRGTRTYPHLGHLYLSHGVPCARAPARRGSTFARHSKDYWRHGSLVMNWSVERSSQQTLAIHVLGSGEGSHLHECVLWRQAQRTLEASALAAPALVWVGIGEVALEPCVRRVACGLCSSAGSVLRAPALPVSHSQRGATHGHHFNVLLYICLRPGCDSAGAAGAIASPALGVTSGPLRTFVAAAIGALPRVSGCRTAPGSGVRCQAGAPSGSQQIFFVTYQCI